MRLFRKKTPVEVMPPMPPEVEDQFVRYSKVPVEDRPGIIAKLTAWEAQLRPGQQAGLRLYVYRHFVATLAMEWVIYAAAEAGVEMEPEAIGGWLYEATDKFAGELRAGDGDNLVASQSIERTELLLRSLTEKTKERLLANKRNISDEERAELVRRTQEKVNAFVDSLLEGR
jgi:hypothetical protein